MSFRKLLDPQINYKISRKIKIQPIFRALTGSKCIPKETTATEEQKKKPMLQHQPYNYQFKIARLSAFFSRTTTSRDTDPDPRRSSWERRKQSLRNGTPTTHLPFPQRGVESFLFSLPFSLPCYLTFFRRHLGPPCIRQWFSHDDKTSSGCYTWEDTVRPKSQDSPFVFACWWMLRRGGGMCNHSYRVWEAANRKQCVLRRRGVKQEASQCGAVKGKLRKGKGCLEKGNKWE